MDKDLVMVLLIFQLVVHCFGTSNLPDNNGTSLVNVYTYDRPEDFSLKSLVPHTRRKRTYGKYRGGGGGGGRGYCCGQTYQTYQAQPAYVYEQPVEIEVIGVRTERPRSRTQYVHQPVYVVEQQQQQQQQPQQSSCCEQSRPCCPQSGGGGGGGGSFSFQGGFSAQGSVSYQH